MSRKNTPLKFAVIGTGFWARFQLAAWQELDGVECVALYNRTRSKAEALGKECGVTAVYDDMDRLLDSHSLDFADIITDVDTHALFSLKCAERGVPAICQKPLAPDPQTAQGMAAAFEKKGLPLYVHENWRWQRPMRVFKEKLNAGTIGRPWRARIQYCNSFPVFENQPFLKELEQFILTDIGTHILDTARFLFGEAKTLYCRTHRVNPGIKGEDAATVTMDMESGLCLNVEMSYASKLENEAFPQTYVEVEGEHGSLQLSRDYWIKETNAAGTSGDRYPPESYPWADPDYDLIHSSIVDCNRNLLAGLTGSGEVETTAQNNLRTLQLVFACYDSARSGEVLVFDNLGLSRKPGNRSALEIKGGKEDLLSRASEEICQESRPDPLRIGLSTYALNWAWGIPGYPVEKALRFPDFLELAKQWGYAGVQIADNAPFLQLSGQARKDLWKQAKSLELFVEIGGRGLTGENLERHIAIAAEAGSPILRFVIDGPGFEPGFEEIPGILARAAGKCAERGIVLAIENHDRFRAHQFAVWFEEVDSPWLGLCLDSVNSYGCGEGFRETINTLLPYTVNFHLKDFRIRRQSHTLGAVIEGTAVGDGFLPVKSVIERLNKIGKCRSAIVEHWTAPEESVEATIAKEMDWCQKSIQNLNAILK